MREKINESGGRTCACKIYEFMCICVKIISDSGDLPVAQLIRH